MIPFPENQETEYGVKLRPTPQLLTDLANKYGKPKVILQVRRIFKTISGKYFFRTSEDESSNRKSYYFTLKEDILESNSTKSNGMKVSMEIDVSVSRAQLQKMISIINTLGYNQVYELSRKRFLYNIGQISLSVDVYPDNYYLEVEGPDQGLVRDFFSKLPIDDLIL